MSIWNALRLTVAVTVAAYVAPASAQTYIEPPAQFLESFVVTPFGANNFPLGRFSVQEFTEMLTRKQLDNGSFPEILGWSRDDNVYMLHVLFKRKALTFGFTHLLDKRSQGRHSYFEGGVGLLAAILR